MNISGNSISLSRSDGKLGVDFDSPETLAKFLAILIEEGEPESSYLIPVLENNGVVPSNDPDFRALLDRMGVTDYTIPNILRARFLQQFRKLERGSDMNLDLSQFETMEREERALFIRHLRLRCQRGHYPTTEVRFVQDVCVPILVAIHEGQGMTDENWHLVQLAESRGFRRSSIEPIIKDAYNHFTSLLNSRQAAKYLGLSQRHSRRVIAQLGKFNGDIRKSRTKQCWLTPVSALDDWLIKHRPSA